MAKQNLIAEVAELREAADMDEREGGHAHRLLREAAVALGTLGGKVKSKRKAAAARENGKKGGAPKKKKNGSVTRRGKHT